jgi:hypothetical protein
MHMQAQPSVQPAPAPSGSTGTVASQQPAAAVGVGLERTLGKKSKRHQQQPAALWGVLVAVMLCPPKHLHLHLSRPLMSLTLTGDK